MWAKLPGKNPRAESFIENLLIEKNIFIAPGTIFGSNGEGYVRFSLYVDESKIVESLKRIDL